MACGCENTCGCLITSPDGTIGVVQSVDEFQLSHLDYVRAVVDTPCVDLSVDVDGALTASPIIDPDPASVALACGPDGLIADLRIDPAGTLPITPTVDGLRFDCCAPAESIAGRRSGDVFFSAAARIPSDAYELAGQPVPRSGDPSLFDALTLYADTADVIAGSAIVTSIPSTSLIQPGMTTEVDGFPGNPSVLSVDGPNQITLNINAASTFPSTASVRVFVWGDGPDITSFFLLPDADQRVIAGVGSSGRITDPQSQLMGGTLGVEQVAMTTAMLVAHGHGISGSPSFTDPGHTHAASADPHAGHVHKAGPNPPGADRSFVMVDTSTIENHLVDNGVGGTDYSIVVGGNDAHVTTTLQQLNNEFTATGGSHSHAITVGAHATDASVGAGTLAVANSPAATDGIPTIQPTIFMRALIQR